MLFMDKKEEVIDIELTPYGKQLLSMGKMKPVYYAFFDDNIMYDAEYAGITEEQNIIQERITQLTPQLQTQYKFTSKGQEGFDVDFGNGEKISTIAPLKKESLTSPLGNSRASGNSYPAIQLRMLSGFVREYNLDYTTEFGIKKIPQINIDINYTVKKGEIPFSDLKGGAAPMDDTPVISVLTLDAAGSFTSDLAPDLSFIEVDHSALLVDIVEQNIDFDMENFNIEVFEVGEQLIPLSFARLKQSNVVNGILIDSIAEEDKVEVPLNSSNVEYYFDIFVDSDIDKEVINNSINSLKSKGLYTDKDYVNEDNVLIREVISDIYGTNVDITDIKDC